MNDDDVEAIYVRWAEKAFPGRGAVTKVVFTQTEGWAGTDVTPGYDAALYVDVTFADGTVLNEEREFSVELMREVVAAAAEWREGRLEQ